MRTPTAFEHAQKTGFIGGARRKHRFNIDEAPPKASPKPKKSATKSLGAPNPQDGPGYIESGNLLGGDDAANPDEAAEGEVPGMTVKVHVSHNGKQLHGEQFSALKKMQKGRR